MLFLQSAIQLILAVTIVKVAALTMGHWVPAMERGRLNHFHVCLNRGAWVNLSSEVQPPDTNTLSAPALDTGVVASLSSLTQNRMSIYYVLGRLNGGTDTGRNDNGEETISPRSNPYVG